MRYKRRNKRILIFLGIVMCLMTAAYAAFYSDLDITGTSNINNNWDIEITNVSVGNTTGNGENVNTPSWDALTASMEANVYESGDSVSYNVEVSNLGSLDAKLDEITKNIKTNNEAVKITFSGYTKGERLYRYGQSGSTKTIVVTVSYNDDYEGELNYNNSTETSVTFNYVQAEGSNTDPDNPEPTTYLLTYDYEENGGTSSTKENEYFNSGTNITLGGSAEKEGYTFIGWNTDKDAETGLNSITLNENKTVYAIYRKTINITYQKEGNIITLSKANDVCNLYNKTTSCEKTLPTVTLSDETNYSFDGWYKGSDKQTIENNKYTFTENTTLIAKVNTLPVMESGPNFQTKIASVKSTVTEIEFVDLDDNNVTAPTPNNTTSWDVSAAGNGSVIAWLNGIKMYIGGKGGVIGNSNSASLFNNFTSVTSINFNNKFDTSNVTNMDKMFSNMQKLTELDLSSFDTSKVTTMTRMFSAYDYSTATATTSSLTSLNVSSFDTSNVTDMFDMFYNCSGLTSLDLSNFNTSKVTNMAWMFSGCENLTELDVSNFDTSNVTYMHRMFSKCNKLTSLDLSSFNTLKVTNMSYMFSTWNSSLNDFENSDLETIIFGNNFITSNVTDMDDMFSGLNSITELDLSSFDTSNVTNMQWMFAYCNKLTELDLSSFDTGNVTNMASMFHNCTSLTTLDLTSFDTSKVTDMFAMFYNCTNLTTIYVSNNFITTAVTKSANMFTDSTKLVGGNGTVYSSSHQDKEYARIDTTNTPGYFTDGLEAKPTATKTTKSITVTANVPHPSGIASYQFSNDNGTTWTNSQASGTYQFTGLTNGQTYQIKVKTIDKNNGVHISKVLSVKTDDISVPTYSQQDISAGTKIIINFNNECAGHGLTCSYKKNNNEWQTVTTNTKEVEFTEGGSIIARVTDNVNTITASTFTVKINPVMMSGPNFQTKIASVKSTITEVEFVDLDDNNVTAPTPNNTTSWDVSAAGNNSVIAWLNGTKMYIGGKGGVIGNSDSSYLFNLFINTRSIDFNDNFDTSNVTNMSAMFSGWDWSTGQAGSSSLTNINFGNKFKTSNVVTMRNMFSVCDKIVDLDLSGFDTSKVTDMKDMFYECTSLTELNISNFDTSKVTNMNSMFYNCTSLTELDIDNFDTSNVTNMQQMFQSCSSLTALDLTNFDTSNVTNMQWMFRGCNNLNSLDLSSFNTLKVTNMAYMFSTWNSSLNNFENSDLETIIFGNNFITSNVTNMDDMFSGLNSITELDLSSFDTSNVTNMQWMFANCNYLTAIYASNKFVTNSVTNSTNMFYNSTNIIGGNGTVYSSAHQDKEYARIDATNTPGYFTDGRIPIIDSVNTTKTSLSITTVVSARSLKGNISKYEFSSDNGSTWIDNGTNNTYTFRNLTTGNSYRIKVRVTNGAEMTTTSDAGSVTLEPLSVPTYEETINGNTTTITITYPDGCSSPYVCTYIKDGGQAVTVTEDSADVIFTDSGTLVATVTEGINTVNSSYTISMPGEAYSGIQTYDIAGSSTFTAPGTGDYYLQVWGAQGGYRSSSTYGGLGGYSYGTVTLNQGDVLYIHTGGFPGNGTDGCGQTICEGGINGGGYRYKYYGGGGASDIRINSDSLYARVIVAGGGGSDGATNKNGMYGGGVTGGSSTQSYSSVSSYGGKGGAQTYSGYSSSYTNSVQATTGLNSNTLANYGGGFGFGGGGVYYSSGYGGAGGGGWYGGSGNVPDSSSDDDRGGGGGSGYVYTESTASSYPSGCLLNSDYYLKDAATVAGNTSFESPSGGTETGHSGNGYVKITYDVNTKISDKLLLETSNVTTKSITVTATPKSGLTVTKYEFSSDNGSTWINNGTNSSYTFNNLTHNTTYNIKVRATTSESRITNSIKKSTNELITPTFSDAVATSSIDTTITYVSGCGSTYTCTYVKNSDSPVTVTSNTEVVNFTREGTLSAIITDGTNTVTATHEPVEPAPTLSFSTANTTSTITVTATASTSTGVAKYEYQIDNGSWIEYSSNVYVFERLQSGTHSVNTRITTNFGTIKTGTAKSVTMNTITAPTYKVQYNAVDDGDVTITYPSGCGSTYTCTYTKNNEAPVEVTTTTKVVNYSADGELTASVTDGTNTVSNSFIVTMPLDVIDDYGVDMLVVGAGDGLYQPEEGVDDTAYVYRGENPNNYIDLGTSGLYRIMSIDSSGNLKVIKDTLLESIIWDPGYSTSISGITSKSSTAGTRYSSTSTDYCYASSTSSYYGCKSWGSRTSTLNSSGSASITQMPWEAGSSTLYDLPTYDSYMNVYLNGGTYPTESGTTTLTSWYSNNVDSLVQSKMVNHLWNVGPVKSDSSLTLAQNIGQEAAYKWRGKVGLMTATDYVRASTNSACTNVYSYINNSSCYSNNSTHNWLNKNSYQWTMSPSSSASARYVWVAPTKITSYDTSITYGDVRPVFYLSSDIPLKGNGTSSNPYYIYVPPTQDAKSTLNKLGQSAKEYNTNTGDGIYEDNEGGYYYRGRNPENYINLGGDLYRIMSIDSSGYLKVIKENSRNYFLTWDPGYSTSISGITSASSTAGTRYSSTSTDYCYNSSASSYGGCNSWGSRTSTLNSAGTSAVTQMPKQAGSSTLYDLPAYDSYMNVYLNGGTYPTESGTTTLTSWYSSNVSLSVQSKMVDHLWNIGSVASDSDLTLAQNIGQEAAYKWRGKVGLMTATDYVRASTNSECTNVYRYNLSSCYSNESNWLSGVSSYNQWTISPLSNSSASVWGDYTRNHYTSVSASNYHPSPVFYLSSDITIKGNGTSNNPYYISIPPTQAAKSTLNKLGQSAKEYNTNSGDGIYEDGEGGYYYRGANPANYINLGSDLYRIMSIDSSGNLKVIKDTPLASMPWDPGYSTSISGITSASSTAGTRYSSTSTDYCYNSSASYYNGCNSWGSRTSTLNLAGTSAVTQMPWVEGQMTPYDLPTYDSYLNVYLNGGTYPTESGTKTLTSWYSTNVASSIQSKMVDHLWNVGPVTLTDSSFTLDKSIRQEAAYKWRGKVGLMALTDYVRASTNSACTYNYVNNSSCFNNGSTDNWLYKSDQWTMSPDGSLTSGSDIVWNANSTSTHRYGASGNHGVRPVFYLSSDISISGTGTSSSNAFTVS